MINVIRINIKNIVNNRAIFSLLLVCQLVCCFMILIIYSLYMGLNLNNDNFTTKISPVQEDTIENLRGRLEPLYDSQDVRNIIVYLEDNIIGTINDYLYVTNGSNINRNGTREAVLGEIYYIEDGYRIGDTIVLLGEDYQIVGFSSLHDKYEVDYSTINPEFEYSYVEIVSINERSNKRIIRQVENSFNSGYEIEKPPNLSLFEASEDINLLLFMISLIFLSIVSIIVFLKFCYQEQHKIMNIYRIIGATKYKISQIAVIIIIMGVFFINLISGILYHLIDKFVLYPNIKTVFFAQLRFMDYIDIFVIYLVISLILSIVLLRTNYLSIRKNNV